MNIKETLKNYIEKGEFFSPDYDRENEILKDFKVNNPTLDQEQTNELVMILKDYNKEWKTKYFVADLLYYYDKFGQDLMDPMLKAAIDHKDPSTNRIFLRPCLRSFGDSKVIQWLIEKFNNSTLKERIGIANLMYWVNISGADASELLDLMTKSAKETDNLIELYYYKFVLPKNNRVFSEVPDDAMTLCKKINGNKEYEHLLYDELGWTKDENNDTLTQYSSNKGFSKLLKFFARSKFIAGA